MEDFSQSVIVTPDNLGRAETKAVAVLLEEIHRRTGILPAVVRQWPREPEPVIAIGLEAAPEAFAGPFAKGMKGIDIPGPEGFSLSVKGRPRPAALIMARDPRGILYGVGRFLRKAELSPGVIHLPSDLSLTTAPKHALRGCQLGYRPKTNAYDAWSPEQFDQYIRELALFGANSIELIPPRSDDEPPNRLMKLPPLDMMVRLVEIIDSYGLDLWIWYPNVGKDYTSAEAIAAELAEREEIFSKLKRINALFIPGGDPGKLPPDVLFPWLDWVAEILWEYHPNARIWVSPQAMRPTREWLDSFYRHVNQRPKWLEGVVFAPWVKTPLPEMRRVVDAGLKIRHYPDITHSVSCQYPVKDWDPALALTLHRECYNPRPVAMKKIHNLQEPYTCGSIAYSEGINDDVNKFIWIDQDWDPACSVIETLRDYARLFIAPQFCEEIAEGFLAEERNWEGPLAANAQVEQTLKRWRNLDKSLPQTARNTYRFQMGLLRAYYDAYIKRRLIRETRLEAEAMEALREAPRIGSLTSMANAEGILRQATDRPVAVAYKRHCERLAGSLFESIGSQLSVARHGAQHRTRGAFMDGIDEPLNDATWLRSEFARIRAIQGEPERQAALDACVNRTNPGPGGFYDNLGAPGSERRILNSVPWDDDPGTLHSPRITFSYRLDDPEDRGIPLAWKSQACALYETPLRFHYEDLDPGAAYSIRVTYTGKMSRNLRLVANDQFLVHDWVQPWTPLVQEFPIPPEATRDGRLVLTWTCGEGDRGAAVAEIWLMRSGGHSR